MPIRGRDITTEEGETVVVEYVTPGGRVRRLRDEVKSTERGRRKSKAELASGAAVVVADDGRADLYRREGNTLRRAGRVNGVRRDHTGQLDGPGRLVRENGINELRRMASDMGLDVPRNATKRRLARLIEMEGGGPTRGENKGRSGHMPGFDGFGAGDLVPSAPEREDEAGNGFLRF